MNRQFDDSEHIIYANGAMRLKGVDHMYDVMEERKNEVKYRKACEVANNLIGVGKLSFEEIATCCGLTIEKVRELAGNKSA